MKVKELIEKLKGFNENANVVDQYGNQILTVKAQNWEIKGKEITQVELEVEEYL